VVDASEDEDWLTLVFHVADTRKADVRVALS
jgi:hypothetical protein